MVESGCPTGCVSHLALEFIGRWNARSSVICCRLVTFWFAVFVGMIGPASAAERLPNLVHSVAVDVEYDAIDCFEARDIKTPNLDRRAKTGT